MQGQTPSDFSTELLRDYRLGILSRECSLLGRKEVLTGKAKFGIFGDGKELAQLLGLGFFATETLEADTTATRPL